MSFSAARSRLIQAQSYMDSRRYDEVEPVIEAALDFLVGLPEDEDTVALAAELAALRTTAAEAAEAERYGAKLRSADREIRFAKEKIEEGNYPASAIEERLANVVVQTLADVPDAVKAETMAEINALRSQLSGDVEAEAVDLEMRVVRPGTATPTEDEARTLSRARGEIMGCRNAIESGRTEGVAEALDEVAATLATVRNEFAGSLLSEIEVLRAESAGAEAAENIRRITSELDRHFSAAEIEEAWQARDAGKAIAYITGRLADDDVRGNLPADTLDRYRRRLAAATDQRARMIKADALDRALPLLAEIEEKLAANAYAGLSQEQGYEVTAEIERLKERIRHALVPVPADDADVLSIQARLQAADEQVAAASGALATARVESDVADHWRGIQTEFADWQQESFAGPGRPGEVPELPLTRLAIMRSGYWLREDATAKLRAENADNPAVQAVYRAAEQTLEDAGAKLHAAYTAVIDAADQLPPPAVENDLGRLSNLAVAARTSFEGTPYQQAVLDRIQAVEERWKAEYADLLQRRQELYDRLSAEAVAAWPGIVAATGASDGFDPADPDAKGATVLLSGVRNRAGWDFNGADFSMRLHGTPVGGNYEPHVTAALEHAAYELKLDVSDRTAWDVIAVVNGPGKLGERTIRVLKDPNGHELGKVEEWPPVDSVQLSIIGLRVGPVAVGPQ